MLQLVRVCFLLYSRKGLVKFYLEILYVSYVTVSYVAVSVNLPEFLSEISNRFDNGNMFTILF